jgi:hypothetical protein
MVFPQWKKTLYGKRSPFIHRKATYKDIPLSHEWDIKRGGELFTDFSYRALFKWKKRVKDELLCRNCSNHLFRTAAYLKTHVAEYPSTLPMCIEIMKSYLSIDGQDTYCSYNLRRAHIYDLTQCKKELGELGRDPLYLLEQSCRDLQGAKMKTRELPSPKAFPCFEREKESKMYLTQLSKPTKEQIDMVKTKVKAVITRYGPQTLTLPPDEAVKSIGPSLYSDDHTPRHDYEKPVSTWKYSWTYQKFKTDAQTEREVWLPPKAYKLVSSWWHFYSEPLIAKVPWLVANDTLKEVRLNLHKRFKPCRSIDLKGFGLQFPHEYILACMDAINEVYPSSQAEEYKAATTAYLKLLSVRVGDKHIKPIRGVGLGYFSNLMTLVVGSILANYDIVQMFNDDILCPDEHYESAIKCLRDDFSFVINEKKSGELWYKNPMFANVTLSPKGTLHYFEVNGMHAAIFLKKEHWERKSLLLMTPFRYRWKFNYHYERLFGFEVSPGECFRNPRVLGIDPTAEYPVGWVKGGLLEKVRQPSYPDEEKRRVWSISFPWKTPREEDFSKKRQEYIEKYKNRRHYMEYDEYLNPRIKERGLQLTTNPDFFLGGYQLPRWADLSSILRYRYTCGRTTMGRYPKKAAHYMLDFLLSRNPIHSWITGGYDIISPFYRIPAPTTEDILLYTCLKDSRRDNVPIVNKAIGIGSLTGALEGPWNFTLITQGKDISSVIPEEDIYTSDAESEEEVISIFGDDQDLDLISDDEITIEDAESSIEDW